jgi:hypothetical protein
MASEPIRRCPRCDRQPAEDPDDYDPALCRGGGECHDAAGRFGTHVLAAMRAPQLVRLPPWCHRCDRRSDECPHAAERQQASEQ